MCTPCVVLFLRTESLQSRPKTASTVATRRILTYTYVSRCAYNPDLPASPFGNLAYLNVLLLIQGCKSRKHCMEQLQDRLLSALQEKEELQVSVHFLQCVLKSCPCVWFSNCSSSPYFPMQVPMQVLNRDLLSLPCMAVGETPARRARPIGGGCCNTHHGCRGPRSSCHPVEGSPSQS